MKTLILWSGGADSTFLLHKLLSETTDEVTTLTFGGQGFASTEAVQEQLRSLPKLEVELQKVRPFSTLKIDFADIKSDDASISRHYYTSFVNYAAPFLNDGTYDRIASGRTWEQHDQTVIPSINIRGLPSTFAAHRLFKKVATRGVLWEPLITHDFVRNYGRYHALTALPQNLSSEIISCSAATYDQSTEKYLACGHCYKCMWDRKVKGFIAEGFGPAEIDFYRRSKSLQYGGGRNLSAVMRHWLPLEMNEAPHNGLDTKEKIQLYTQSKGHFSIANQNFAEDDIWNMSTLTEAEAIMPSDINPAAP
jgi:7-cyano-7-deazaguanine synthase in queuosine biosynthesis